jgi:hypothetical protein
MNTRFTLSLLALAACGDNLPGMPDDEPEPVTGRTLTGDQVAYFRTLDRSLLDHEETDLWSTVIEVHAPDGDGWRVVPGTGHRDGSFEVPGVPDGHVWLRTARRPFGDVFYWTDADHVAFDENVLGPLAPRQARDGDQLKISVEGAAPWAEGDSLAWFVPDDIVYDMDLLWNTPPALASTAIDATIDWTGRSLADAPAGDASLLVQYSKQEHSGLTMRAPVRAAQPALRQKPGVTGTLATSLVEPPTLPYRVQWGRDLVEAERTAIHPTRAGASTYHSWALTAIPGIVDGEMWVGIEYPLAQLDMPEVLHDTTPLELEEMEIPNPFPREWLIDSYVTMFPVELPLPDSTPFTLEAVIGQRTTELAGASEPMLTPLRAPTIAGHDGFARSIVGVGTTPEIAWTLPAVGTPTSYRLQLIQAVTNPPIPYRPGWYVAAELIVPGDVTRVRVPADVLQPGETYAVVARTFAQPGHDVRTRPFVSRGTAAFADTIFGPFTP